MLICVECGAVFEMARIVFERHGQDTPPCEEIYVCPKCESTDIHQTHRCEICGEWIADDYIRLVSGERICSECYTLHVLEDD